MKKKFTGAGFVIYFNNKSNVIKDMKNDVLYLTLIDNAGKGDFPKGAIDEFEDPFECAVRETEEETSLINKKHYTGFSTKSRVFSKGLVMFTGIYNLDLADIHTTPDINKNIKIFPNRKTGVIEHKSFFWGTYEESKKVLPPYLKEVLDWAKLNIED